MGKTPLNRGARLREALALHFGVKSPSMLDLLLDSWAPKSRTQYESALNKWFTHCDLHKIEPFMASHQQGAEFLVDLFSQTTLGYSALGTVRSALSSVLPMENGMTFGKNKLVSRLMKGIFRKRPALPKYTVQWDVGIVFRHFMSCSELGEISLEFQVMKLALLFCILSGQRTQSLGELRLENMHLDNSRAIFYISEILKTTRPTFHTESLDLKSFPLNKVLCPVSCLLQYLHMTGRSEKETKIGPLFLSYANHKPIKSGTIAKYVVVMLEQAGINISTFSAHSCRGASTSAAKRSLSLADIRKAAGWTNCSTFARYYDRPVMENFGEVILKDFQNRIHAVEHSNEQSECNM